MLLDHIDQQAAEIERLKGELATLHATIKSAWGNTSNEEYLGESTIAKIKLAEIANNKS